MSNVNVVEPKHEFTYDGAVLRVYHANKGEGLPKHTHAFSHATFCANGSCYIRVEGKEVTVTKNDTPINLGASKWHEIEAAEDNTVFINVFSEGKY